MDDGQGSFSSFKVDSSNDIIPELKADEFINLAKTICNIPFAFIYFENKQNKYFKACNGLTIAEIEQTLPFCISKMSHDGVFIINDLLTEPLFLYKPVVDSKSRLRFYAGVPLITENNYRVGFIALFDTIPREISEQQKNALLSLAKIIVSNLELINEKNNERIIDKPVFTEKLENEPFLLLKSFLDVSENGLALIDKNGDILALNQVLIKLFDTQDSSLIQLINNNFKNPAKLINSFKETYNSPHPEEQIFEILESKNGKVFEVTSIPLKVNKQMLNKIIRFKDITEGKQIQNEFIKLNSIFEGILESLDQQVFWCLDIKTLRFLYISSGIEKIYGYSMEDLKKNPNLWKEITHPEDIYLLEEAEKLILQGLPSTYNIRIIRSDGAIRLLRRQYTPILDSENNVIYLNGMTVDITEQKISEQLLIESEELFKGAFNNAPFGISLVSLTGKFLRVNKTFCNIFGYSEKELLEKYFIDITFDNDKEMSQSYINKIIESDSALTFEKRYINKKGEIIWAKLNISLHRSSDGKPLYFITHTEDITVQKIAEEKLQEQKDQLYEAQKISHMGSWKWDILKNELDWSKELYSIYGLNPDEIKISFEDFLERIYHEDRENTKTNIQHSLQTLEPFEFSERIIRSDGVMRYLKSKGKVIADDNGKPIKMIGICHDITEQRNVETRVYEQAALLDKAQDAIIVRDLNYNVIYWNKSAERLYGWTEREVMENKITEHLYVENTDELITAQESILENGEWIGELNQLTKSGNEITVQSRWTLIHDELSNPKSILTVNTDITEKKKLEAQFYRSQRLESINTLTGGIAHDLNNILAPIMMAVHMLKLNLSEVKKNTILATLEKSIQRGSDIIKQLLIFGKGIEGNKVTVHLNKLMIDMEKMIKETFPKSITSEINISDSLWSVLGDSTQLQQILLNLFVNARDAMPDGGIIKASTENIIIDENYVRMNPDAKKGPFVCISVTDTGIGIPQKIIDKIFEPFFTTKELGTGLGLYTLIGIVKSHGGFVIVYSEIEKGSEFKVFIPAMLNKPDNEQIVHIDDSDFSKGNGELIMIVDDEASILEIASNIIVEAGYRVITASNGSEALERYKEMQDEIKIIVTDINMPVMSGFMLIETLYNINPNIIFIASSGLLMSTNSFDTKTFDIKAFLQKPYTAENLLKKISKLLSKQK